MDIVANIKSEFEKILHQIDWMQPQTKAHALEKLSIMELKIGYPDELLDERKVIHHYRNVKFGSLVPEFLLINASSAPLQSRKLLPEPNQHI